MSVSNKTKRGDNRFFNRIWKKLHFGHLAKEKDQNAMMASYSSGLFPYSQHLRNGIYARRSRNEMTKFSWVEVESSAIPRMVDLQPMVWKIRFQRQVRVQHYCVDWPLSESQISATLYDRETKEYLEVRCHKDNNGLTIIESDEDLFSRDSLLLEGLPVSIKSESIFIDNPSIMWSGKNCQIFDVNAIPGTEYVDATLSISSSNPPTKENWQIDGLKLIPLSITKWKPNTSHSLYNGPVQVIEEWTGGSHVLTDTYISEDSVVLKTAQGHPVFCKNVKQEGFWVRLGTSLNGDEMFNPLDEVFTNFSVKSLRDGYKEIPILKKRGDLRMVSLSRLPKGKELSINVRTSDLRIQHSACERLRDAPLHHHIPLMRLVARVDKKSRWPNSNPSKIKIDKWYTRVGGEGEGSEDQRNFVRKAMSSPDFAFLEGPPGSGKTETIGELILQILAANSESKILLCGSTQASIDNVLSRFAEHDFIQALRVVNSKRWLEKPDQHYQMVHDHSIHRLVEPEQVQELKQSLGSYGDDLENEDLSSMVLNRSNLVAATIEGVANHPSIKDALNEKLTPPKALFDYLIIDEASKTTFTQFLVPAIFCRKWVLVGDVAQLPPFSNDMDISGILNRLEERNGDALRRACQIIAQVGDDRYLQSHPRILIEDGRVIEEILIELGELSKIDKRKKVKWGFLGNVSKNIPVEELIFINSIDLSSSDEDTIGTARLRLTGCDVIVIERGALDDNLFSLVIPTTHLHPSMLGKKPFNGNGSLNSKSQMPPSRYMRQIKMTLTEEEMKSNKNSRSVFNSRRGLNRSDTDTWGDRIAWRLKRIYELKNSKNVKLREKYFNEVSDLIPRQLVKCSECKGEGIWMSKDKENECLACRGNGQLPRWARSVEEVRNFTLPSILESLQYGYSGPDAGSELSLAPRFPNTLSNGFSDKLKSTRFQSIPYQHRMHPSISAFPRNNFYFGGSDESKLQDAMATLSRRDSFSLIQGDNRRLWFDVKSNWVFGANYDEVMKVKSLLIDTISWFKEGGIEESSLAILTPFNNQSEALREMMDEVLKNHGGKGMRGTRGVLREGTRRLILFCSTVDKFQGQESDIVILSLRTVGRIGNFDSPNRVNVALTRARECLLIVGDRKTYLQSSRGSQRVDEMLRSLCIETPLGESNSGHWRVVV